MKPSEIEFFLCLPRLTQENQTALLKVARIAEAAENSVKKSLSKTLLQATDNTAQMTSNYDVE